MSHPDRIHALHAHVYTCLLVADAWCELVLAFRSLATVAVFLLSAQRRAQCIDVSAVLKGILRPTRSQHKKDDNTTASTALLSPHENVTVQGDVCPTNATINAKDITFCGDTPLAVGGFGAVWKGRWSGCDDFVAIKLMYRTGNMARTDNMADSGVMDSAASVDFERECAVLQRVQHPNLLSFYGHGVTSDNRNFIVTELMAGGSLASALHDSTVDLPWHVRVSIALQVATGMAYLHHVPLLHRDLKSMNVLLDGRGRAVVCDFGTARAVRRQFAQLVYSPFTGTVGVVQPLSSGVMSARVDLDNGGGTALPKVPLDQLVLDVVDASGTSTKAVGTLLWMAPEVFRGDTDYGPAVDVYSFGIVLWELSTRKLPWDDEGVDNQSPPEFFTMLNKALQTGVRPLLPASLVVGHPAFCRIMLSCWAGDPADRPSFDDVVPQLAACLRSLSPVV